MQFDFPGPGAPGGKRADGGQRIGGGPQAHVPDHECLAGWQRVRAFHQPRPADMNRLRLRHRPDDRVKRLAIFLGAQAVNAACQRDEFKPVGHLQAGADLALVNGRLETRDDVDDPTEENSPQHERQQEKPQRGQRPALQKLSQAGNKKTGEGGDDISG